jgi:hypothetical protein
MMTTMFGRDAFDDSAAGAFMAAAPKIPAARIVTSIFFMSGSIASFCGESPDIALGHGLVGPSRIHPPEIGLPAGPLRDCKNILITGERLWKGRSGFVLAQTKRPFDD